MASLVPGRLLGRDPFGAKCKRASTLREPPARSLLPLAARSSPFTVSAPLQKTALGFADHSRSLSHNGTMNANKKNPKLAALSVSLAGSQQTFLRISLN